MKYYLYCPECKSSFNDAGFSFNCPSGCNSIIKTEYRGQPAFRGSGIWRYSDYLPINSRIEYYEFPAILKSQEYSEMYGSEIYFILNGYVPDFNVRMRTCTFKELEVLASLKYSEKWRRDITLSSVGNTANAFIELGKYAENVHITLFIPEEITCCMFELERSENVTLVGVKGGYDFATNFARIFAQKNENVIYEGGGLNFARRDALATMAYAFVERFGFSPDFYVQSVGSGTGVIAFFDGMKRIGMNPPSVILSQNIPFIPIVEAWNKNLESVPYYDFDPVEKLYAKVLSNKRPLYNQRGGLKDILTETKGGALGITTEEAKIAGSEFKKIYGFELYPAAEVAMASLDKISIEGKKVLVNITGSGLDLLKKDYRVREIKFDYIVESEEDLEMIE